MYSQQLPKPEVEVRRASYESLVLIAKQRHLPCEWPHLAMKQITEAKLLSSASDVTKIFEAHKKGLLDYSTDQRGDVGSWIRVSCSNGIRCLMELLPEGVGNIKEQAVNLLLRLSLEKLQVVRLAAIRALNVVVSFVTQAPWQPELRPLM